MRLAALLLAGALQIGGCAMAQSDDRAAHFIERIALHETLIEEMGAISARDGYIRERIIAQFKTFADDEAAEREAFIEGTTLVFDRIDQENAERLKVLIETWGWRELYDASPRMTERMLTVVSHAGHDTAFQAQTLENIRPLVVDGLVDPAQYAQMSDKLAIASGRPQRYGSQFDCIDGAYQPMRMEAPEAVDARRAEVELKPLAIYAEEIADMYGPCPSQ